MKRKDAIRKVATVCQRLAEVDLNDFYVVPLRLYAFGSVLTDKPNPTDVDLLFEYENRPDLDADDILYRLSYGKPLPSDQASSYLRQGMKMIRIEFLERPLEEWLRSHFFPSDTVFRLIWEPGFDWRQAIAELEAKPLKWDPEAEARHKYIQETARRIAEEEGKHAARKWLREQA